MLAGAAPVVAQAPGAQAPGDRPLRLMMLDAEGGAAALFVTPEGTSLLVDTGWPGGMKQDAPRPDGTPAPPPPAATVDRIVAGMRALGLTRIDHLLVTHYHLDHVGGITDLLARVPVGEVIDHGPNREPAPAGDLPFGHPVRLYRQYEAAMKGVTRRSVKPGDTVAIGSMSLRIVSGDGTVIARPLQPTTRRTAGCDVPDKTVARNENDFSLGFVLEFGRARVLDLGDLTFNEEKRLVCPASKLGPVDLLLVGHHGSEQSNSPPMLDAVAPRVALVANGARKGGDASVFAGLSAARAKPVIWHQHLATRSPAANPPPDRVANITEQPDGGYSLAVTIGRDGAMEVVNGRNGYRERYPAR